MPVMSAATFGSSASATESGKVSGRKRGFSSRDASGPQEGPESGSDVRDTPMRNNSVLDSEVRVPDSSKRRRRHENEVTEPCSDVPKPETSTDVPMSDDSLGAGHFGTPDRVVSQQDSLHHAVVDHSVPDVDVSSDDDVCIDVVEPLSNAVVLLVPRIKDPKVKEAGRVLGLKNVTDNLEEVPRLLSRGTQRILICVRKDEAPKAAIEPFFTLAVDGICVSWNWLVDSIAAKQLLCPQPIQRAGEVVGTEYRVPLLEYKKGDKKRDFAPTISHSILKRFVVGKSERLPSTLVPALPKKLLRNVLILIFDPIPRTLGRVKMVYSALGAEVACCCSKFDGRRGHEGDCEFESFVGMSDPESKIDEILKHYQKFRTDCRIKVVMGDRDTIIGGARVPDDFADYSTAMRKAAESSRFPEIAVVEPFLHWRELLLRARTAKTALLDTNVSEILVRFVLSQFLECGSPDLVDWARLLSRFMATCKTMRGVVTRDPVLLRLPTASGQVSALCRRMGKIDRPVDSALLEMVWSGVRAFEDSIDLRHRVKHLVDEERPPKPINSVVDSVLCSLRHGTENVCISLSRRRDDVHLRSHLREGLLKEFSAASVGEELWRLSPSSEVLLLRISANTCSFAYTRTAEGSPRRSFATRHIAQVSCFPSLAPLMLDAVRELLVCERLQD
jgi:hypothetical protein